MSRVVVSRCRLELSDDQVAAICRALIDHTVQFVVVGGMAAWLHDTGHATVDVDICPSTDDANLARLTAGDPARSAT